MKNLRISKILAIVLITVLGLFVLTACSYDVQLFGDVDFEKSPFKHITNGGKGGEEPYNISAITGATLTVEGPAIKNSVPLSTKELENQNEGLVRGFYKDKAGKAVYEGLDVYYLLNNMSEGDNGIILTDTAYKVIFKNDNRETIAELTIEDIKKAHNEKQPVIIAYGVANKDQSLVAPFVFSGANKGEHTIGYVKELNNEDGCLKLVYNYTKYGKNKQYKKFDNCAYIYVVEESAPGFKHSKTSGEAYANPNIANYVISISGKSIGYELNFTVEELEALVEYDKKGNIKEGGLGYREHYSLANNTYWYVNEYEGLDLYKLLRYVGMPSAEEFGEDAKDTYVTFYAADGFTSAEKFNIETLASPENFGFYQKNSADFDDGTYVSTNADLVDTGYPILLAYGVNSYPYTIKPSDPGYISGISNNGGPMRVIFGKAEYGHANGSNQIQYLSDIAIGPKYAYSTHAYTPVKEQKDLADNELKVIVNNVDGSVLINENYTVADIEDVLYGEDVSSNQIKAAKIKGVYEAKKGKGYKSDVYEGINLEYFLQEIIGIPGTNGTVVFSDGKNKLEIELTDLFTGGFNAEKGISDQKAMIAFAKNGSPLVPDEKSKGYVDKIILNPLIESNPATYEVDNSGGPLAIIIPSTSLKKSDAKSVMNVTSITVNVEPDQYAHLEGEAAKLASNTIKFYGEGVNAAKTYKVSDIEGMQKMAETLDFDILTKKGMSKERYRGIGIYDLLLDVGLRYNAHEVIVHSSDGSKQTFPLGDLRGDEKGKALLAFGQGDVKKAIKIGAPLNKNTGGPLKLVVPQKDKNDLNGQRCIKDVVAVEVTAIEIKSWAHLGRDVYAEFLDYEFELVVKNDKQEVKKTIKLKDLEAMTDLVERTNYSVLEIGTCEGINLWGLIMHYAADVPGIKDPVSVTAYASDNYSKDYLSIFGMDALKNGVVDGDGNRKPIIICYAINGYPLVEKEDHEGYTGLVKNAYGPLRFITETNQGAAIKYAKKVVVTVKGSDEIKLK
ncbi:MAG: molybdopterin-dependent oxidoreductase [Ruminococcaceae bacterium]|nr:molybdopterin-dependent oxidoreductase [Oscillospiraceae bacterium]